MQMMASVIKNIENIDEGLAKKAQARLDSLTKPQGSLGRLEELAKAVVAITGKEDPVLKDKVIFTLAADHGVAGEKVSAYPQEVTAQMVYNFLRGGAGINVLAKHAGARVVVVDMGVAADLKTTGNLVVRKINHGTKNMARGPAMTREEAVRSVETGMEVFEDEFKKGIDIVGIGEMGIANTTASAAMTAVLTGRTPEEVVGRGTGIDDETLKNKIKIIEKSLEVNKPGAGDPLGVLSKIGGFEIGGLAGIILASASRKIPVVLDGFISGAAALLADGLAQKTRGYMIASHCSAEKGHKIILKHLGLDPLLDLNLRLGEGTGAALGISLVDAATKILTQMATFKSAGVSERNSG